LDAFGLHYIPNVLTTIGLIIALAFLGSRIFRRFGIPQVVGFIVMGVILGTSFLNIVPLEIANELTFISEIALGLIGFDIGSHLTLREMKKLGRSILFIVIFEAFGTFALVTLGLYALTGTWHIAFIFGALASATAPAATVDVLAEYETRGPLTTSLLAVVGMDDALSLLLYSVAATITECMILTNRPLSPLTVIGLPLIEIGGSLILGVSAGILLQKVLSRMKRFHDAMAICIGFVFLSVGLSQALGFSLILTSMIMGMVVVNRDPIHSRQIRHTIEQAGPIIYVLFFALVGARFQISLLPSMGLLGLAYIVLRTIGKFGGAWIGGVLGRAAPAVRDNLGLGLLSQAGVAIGLALDSAQRFAQCGPDGAALGQSIIGVITATTFVVQIIGPICVKFAVHRAGEVGMAAVKDPWAI